MSGDPSTARPGGAGFRAGGGSDTSGRLKRVEVTGPVAATRSTARPAVKDSPARSNGSERNAAVEETPAGAGHPAVGRPTEVYDPVRRQWVSVGGTDEQPAVEATTATGSVVTAVPQPGVATARKARLVVSTVDPWSVMKLSFVLSLAGAIILLVTVWLMWLLLSNGGVFTSVDSTVGDIAGSSSSISIVDIFSLRRVMGIALMLAVVQVVLVTALATLVAFLYNLASGLVGGLDVTLAEDR